MKRCAICGDIITQNDEWVWFGFDGNYAHKYCMDNNIIPW